MATPHLRRDGCWTYNSRTLIVQQKRQECKSNICVSAGQMSIPSVFRSFMGRNQFKKVRPRPLKKSAGKRTYAKDCGVCSSLFQFVPKKLEQDFSVFTCGFARFAESCSNSVFRIGTGFFRVYLRFCSFVPIVPIFSKSYIYKYIYRPLPIFFFSRALG